MAGVPWYAASSAYRGLRRHAMPPGARFFSSAASRSAPRRISSACRTKSLYVGVLIPCFLADCNSAAMMTADSDGGI